MEGISDKELITYRTKNLKKIDETGFIQRLQGAGQPQLVLWNDSIELAQQLTLSKEEKHIIAKPNIEPTFLHKFHQLYPLIQKLYYDSNSAVQ